MQKFNYHSHTKRCGHAIGEDEQYVIEAIKNGYTHMGFSDHAPYRDGYAPGERMAKEELEEYIESVMSLKKKYRNQIEIRIGLEFEMFEDQLDELQQYRQMFDYMIVGQHGPALFEPEFYECHSDEDVLKYASLIKKACDLGLCDYIAHPDLYMFSKDEFSEAAKKSAEIICECAQQYQIPLEINLNGLKYGKAQLGNEYRYRYPYRGFWEIASKYDVSVVYGLDAHEPKKYGDLNAFKIVDEILAGIKLNKQEEWEIEAKGLINKRYL